MSKFWGWYGIFQTLIGTFAIASSNNIWVFTLGLVNVFLGIIQIFANFNSLVKEDKEMEK